MNETGTLTKRIEELEGLNRLAQTLCSTLDVGDMLRAIVNQSTVLCHARYASILLFDPSTKEIAKTLIHQSGSKENIDHTLNMIVAGWVIEHGTPILSHDLIPGLGLQHPPDRFRKYGSILAVPLVVSGRTIGILNLLNDRSGPTFDDNSLRIASIIAQQSAQFIHNAKLQQKLFEENQRLRHELQQQYKVHGIVGVSKKMKEVLDLIPLIAKSNATVLVCGETGTGKELVARAIHFQSSRAEKPFVPLNCAALPADLIESELFGHEKGAFTGAASTVVGKFELADGGTIFLDEISEMALDLQVKFLRVLEDKKFFRLGSGVEQAVDVHVIAATNKDLETLVRQGKFREDLFYRLNVMPVFLPPLRERKEDIPVLAQHFLDEFSHRTKCFSDDAAEFLTAYEWKGNVRELRNIVERISLLIPSELISADQLRTLSIAQRIEPTSTPEIASTLFLLLQSNDGKLDLLEEVEKTIVKIALQQSHGNASEAARTLGIDRKALERRKEKFGL